jgi:hypothetical protein
MESPAYIPILKWQHCEKRALLGLDPEVQQKILPCIEIRERKFHTTFIQTYSKLWNQAGLFDYSDPAGLLGPDRESQISHTILQCKKHALPLLPVLNPADAICHPENPFLEKFVSGGKIFLRPRIKLDDMNQLLDRHILPVISRCKSAGIKVSVLADLGCTPIMNDNHRNQLSGFLRRISTQHVEEVYLASGAYPGTLKGIGQGVGEVSRDDWLLWRALKETLQDISLGYSDYASVCPTWSEAVKTKIGPLAIRYAIQDKWLIVRGGKEKTTEEAINLSKLFFVVYKTFAESREFSIGNRNLHAKADDSAPSRHKRFSAADHVWEGLDHHISYVIKRQYSS